MKGRQVQHLYLRAGFGISYKELASLKSRSKIEIVKDLFLKARKYVPIALDLSEFEFLKKSKKEQIKLNAVARKKIRKKSREKVKELNIAWIERMNHPTSILKEKMVLFWANLFVCADNNIFHIQKFHNVLRQHALGNFRDFTKAIAREPSMIKYLNNQQNIKESPNENFARELMELFMLGVGNYTEKDIKEAARAFTGWSFRRDGSFFLKKKKHDYDTKTFLGKTGDFDGDDIIDRILEQKQAARHICKKIYTYFVNPTIDESRLEELTSLFYQDYDIQKLMQFIFNSDWFYDENNIGVKIKSPIELLVGLQQIVPFEFKKKKQLFYVQKMLGQILLKPPNVAGWKGGQNWIDSNTLMFRLKLPSLLLNNAVINLVEKGDYEDTYEKQYETKSKKRFFKMSTSWDVFEKQYQDLSPELLKNMILIASINKDTESFLSNIKIIDNKNYCLQLMSTPEYQLC